MAFDDFRSEDVWNNAYIDERLYVHFDKQKQVGGDHYKKLKIQPLEYCLANEMGIMEHGVVKYVTRHQDKGGAEDIRKGIDYMIKILKIKYGEDYNG